MSLHKKTGPPKRSWRRAAAAAVLVTSVPAGSLGVQATLAAVEAHVNSDGATCSKVFLTGDKYNDGKEHDKVNTYELVVGDVVKKGTFKTSFSVEIVPPQGGAVTPWSMNIDGWDGFDVNKSGKVGPCGDQDTDKKISFCHAAGQSGNYVFLTTAREVFFQAGHVDHEGDVYPAGSFIKNGETVSWPAQGDQSLLDSGCVKPPKKIDIPATPSAEDPCGPDNATWNQPADTAVLDWELGDNGHLTVTIIAENTVFTDGTTSHDFGIAVDSGEKCPPGKIDIPATPSAEDPCGPDNATWNQPADTAVLDWELGDNGHLTVTIIAENTVFTDGTTSHDFGIAVDSGEKCPPVDSPPSVGPPAVHQPPPPTFETGLTLPIADATDGGSAWSPFEYVAAAALLGMVALGLGLVFGPVPAPSFGRRRK